MSLLPPLRKRRVPAWMTSYSDMMTNMLCFFILMVALANQQEAGLKESGMGSHLESLEALGLPGIRPSTRTLIPRDSPLAQYQAPRIDPLEREHWVEHTEKTLIEEFDRLEDVEVRESTATAPLTLPLGLRFSPRSDRLTLADRRDLDRLSRTLTRLEGRFEIYGAALSSETQDPAEALRLSLKRATETARYLGKCGVPPSRLVAIGRGTPELERGRPARKLTLVWRRNR